MKIISKISAISILALILYTSPFAEVVPSKECTDTDYKNARIFYNENLIADLTKAYDASSMVSLSHIGEVSLQFRLDHQGNMIHIISLDANHPEFSDIALDHFSEFHTQPENIKPECATSLLNLKIKFILDSDQEATPGFQSTGSPDANLPIWLQFDKSPIPKNITKTAYPFDLAIDSQKGKASVKFIVDKQGLPTHITIISSSQPEFGQALKARVRAWRFSPATLANKPANALMRYDAEYDPDTSIRPGHRKDGDLNASAVRIAKAVKNGDALAVDKKTLDAPLAVIYQPDYEYPAEAPEQAVTAKVIVEFFIDQAGHVQLPRLILGAQEDYDWAVIDAVNRWQFRIPRVNGKPVVTKSQAVFEVGK